MPTASPTVISISDDYKRAADTHPPVDPDTDSDTKPKA